MSADQIADNFTLSQDEKSCICDKCNKKFLTEFMGDIRDHFKNGCKNLCDCNCHMGYVECWCKCPNPNDPLYFKNPGDEQGDNDPEVMGIEYTENEI